MEESRSGIESVRLEGEHHALLQCEVSPARDDRLLLMPPRAHAVPDEDGRVLPAELAERLDGEVVDAASGHAGAAGIDGRVVGVAVARVVLAKRGARLAENGQDRKSTRLNSSH